MMKSQKQRDKKSREQIEKLDKIIKVMEKQKFKKKLVEQFYDVRTTLLAVLNREHSIEETGIIETYLDEQFKLINRKLRVKI